MKKRNFLLAVLVVSFSWNLAIAQIDSTPSVVENSSQQNQLSGLPTSELRMSPAQLQTLLQQIMRAKQQQLAKNKITVYQPIDSVQTIAGKSFSETNLLRKLDRLEQTLLQIKLQQDLTTNSEVKNTDELQRLEKLMVTEFAAVKTQMANLQKAPLGNNRNYEIIEEIEKTIVQDSLGNLDTISVVKTIVQSDDKETMKTYRPADSMELEIPYLPNTDSLFLVQTSIDSVVLKNKDLLSEETSVDLRPVVSLPVQDAKITKQAQAEQLNLEKKVTQLNDQLLKIQGQLTQFAVENPTNESPVVAQSSVAKDSILVDKMTAPTLLNGNVDNTNYTEMQLEMEALKKKMASVESKNPTDLINATPEKTIPTTATDSLAYENLRTEISELKKMMSKIEQQKVDTLFTSNANTSSTPQTEQLLAEIAELKKMMVKIEQQKSDTTIVLTNGNVKSTPNNNAEMMAEIAELKKMILENKSQSVAPTENTVAPNNDKMLAEIAELKKMVIENNNQISATTKNQNVVAPNNNKMLEEMNELKKMVARLEQQKSVSVTAVPNVSTSASNNDQLVAEIAELKKMIIENNNRTSVVQNQVVVPVPVEKTTGENEAKLLSEIEQLKAQVDEMTREKNTTQAIKEARNAEVQSEAYQKILNEMETLKNELAEKDKAIVVVRDTVVKKVTPPSRPTFTSLGVRQVFFSVNSFQLTTQSNYTLDEIISIYNANQNVNISLRGFADKKGAAAYNIQLSQKRAEQVRQYLLARGVTADKISTNNLGMDYTASDPNYARRV